MFNYQNGKRLVTAGFALSLAIVILNVALNFFGYIIMGGIGGFFATILSFISMVSLLSVCITAGGYGIMWLSNREILDFAAAALLVLNAFGSLLFVRFLGFNYGISNLVTGALSAALYLVLAIRVKDKNRMLFLLLGCAILFRIVITMYYAFSPSVLPYVLVYLVASAGNIVCAGLCFLASRQD